MAEEKKDLTSLSDVAKAMEASGTAPPVPEGSVMDEQPIDKVEMFESLEDYSNAHPTPEPPAEPALSGIPGLEPPPPPEEPPASELSAQLPAEDAFVTTPPTEPPTGLQGVTGMETLEMPQPATPEPTFSPGGSDLSALASVEPPPPLADAVTEDAAVDLAPAVEAPSVEAPPAPEPIEEPLRPASRASPGPLEPMEKIKQYSEQFSSSQLSVAASFPFSLLITGQLAPEEKERLMDILARENMGIREIDLEPQFESGKILIPRISEYAGVLLVGALRSTRAKLRLGPSDTVFATSDTQDSGPVELDSGARSASTYSSDAEHPAEHLPITSQARLPGQLAHALVDIVTASAALKTLVVEAERSPEYQELLDALQRELKYKAFRKGASAIVNFSVQLTQLQLPSHYRVMVSGSAVRARTS